jgi:hypothetical protein
MYIDFAQIPAFIGVVVMGVIVSFIGNLIGLIIAGIIRRASGNDRSEDGLITGVMFIGCFQLAPAKVLIAAVAAGGTAYVVGSAAAAAGPVMLISGAIGLLFTLLLRNSARV